MHPHLYLDKVLKWNKTKYRSECILCFCTSLFHVVAHSFDMPPVLNIQTHCCRNVHVVLRTIFPYQLELPYHTENERWDISWELQITRSQAVPIVGCREGVEQLEVWFSLSPHQYRVWHYHVEEASAFLPDECDWFIVSPSLGCLICFDMVENESSILNQMQCKPLFMKPYVMEYWIPRNS